MVVSHKITLSRQLVTVSFVLAMHNVAAAEVRISGPIENVVVEAQAEPLQSVLDRLSAEFTVGIQGHTSLNQAITGRFEGPLETVLTELLDTRSFVVRRVDGRLVVQVMRTPRSIGSALASAPDVNPSPFPAPAVTAGDSASHQTTAARPFPAPDGSPAPHSPEAQDLARQILGPDVPPLQIDEQFFRVYANRASRADTRYRGGVQ
jgi:hypothetical protein